MVATSIESGVGNASALKEEEKSFESYSSLAETWTWEKQDLRELVYG